MKMKLNAVLLLLILTGSTVFAADAPTVRTEIAPPLAVSKTLFLNNNLNMEYCTVDLADRRSHLNVRTWEGEVTGKLRHGTRVFVNEYSGEWARVSVKRGRRWASVGWVDSTFLLC